MLDDRKAAVLRAIVREYVRTGKPVGSAALAKRYRLKVSAATVRNDMGLLEDLGYVAQPHTSAGRVPTDLGYRWFIDHWPNPDWPTLPAAEQRKISTALGEDFGGLEDALEGTSHILSGITEASAVVVAPPSRSHRLRRCELISRAARKATIILIADTGVVEQAVVEFDREVAQDELDEMARAINVEAEKVEFEDISHEVRQVAAVPQGDREVIADAIAAALKSSSPFKIFRDGTSNILDPEKFTDLETAKAVVSALEEPESISMLLEDLKGDTGESQPGALLVFVGREVPVEDMRACAVVFAPYGAGEGRGGTLGVVGPMRMDYPHTISAVRSIATSLSELLDSLGG